MRRLFISLALTTLACPILNSASIWPQFQPLSAAAATPGDDKRVTALVEQGTLLCRTKKYSEAEGLAKEALAINPASTAAMCLLSRAYRHLGKGPLSMSWLQQALKLEPNNYLVHLEFARYFNGYNRFPQAMEATRRAMALAPNNAEVFFTLGWIQHSMVQEVDAEKSLRRAIKLDGKKAQQHKLLGMVLELQKRYDEAMSEYQIAARMEPTRDTTVNAIGMLLIIEGKKKEAREFYLDMAKKFPKSIEPYLNLARLAEEDRDYKMAEALLRKATVVSPASGKAWVRLAQMLTTERKLDDALKAARIAYNFNSQDDEVASTLAMAFWDKDNPKEAERYMQRSVQLSFTQMSKLLHQNMLVRMKFVNGKAEEGMELAKQCYSMNKQNPAAIAAMAWALMNTKKYDEGLAMLKTARINNPKDRTLTLDYLEGLCGAGRYDQARIFGRELVNRDVHDRKAWICLLWVANKTHNKADVAEALKHVDVGALSAQESMEVGFSGLEGGMDRQSFPALKKALDVSPESAELILNTRDPRDLEKRK